MFTLSAAASVNLRFATAQPGREAGKSCMKPTRSNDRKPRCIRYVTVGSFTVNGRRGSNAVPFTGTLPGRKPLPAGNYKLTATPTGSAHNTGLPRTTNLTISHN